MFKYLLCSLLPVLLLQSVCADVKVSRTDFKADQESLRAYMAQPIRFWGGRFLPDPKMQFSLITLSNSKSSFTFYIHGKPAEDGKWPVSIGMPRPSESNWYLNSFFTFNAGNLSPENCHTEIVDLQGSSTNGSFTLRYSNGDFRADLKIMLQDEDDKLLITFTPSNLPPATDRYKIRLLCYPSSLAGGAEAGKHLRQREAMTSARKLELGQYRLSKDEHWVLFYDNYFDVQQNRGDGPCAALFNPKDTIGNECSIANYGCQLFLWYAANKPASFILWDFKGWGNQAAREFMSNLKIE